jgi:RNA polymerase sigma-70 factor (ECF subfamily)
VNPDCQAFLVRQAAIQASLLVASRSFGSCDWADLRQEIILDLLRRSPKFDESRGDWRCFVRGIARNHASVLIVRKRRPPTEVSFDDLHGDAVSGRREVPDFPDQRQAETANALHLSVDVERVIEGLPPRLRSLAHLLTQMSVTEVCTHMGKSRSRVYQMTRQLRDAFVRAGFQPRRTRRSERSR